MRFPFYGGWLGRPHVNVAADLKMVEPVIALSSFMSLRARRTNCRIQRFCSICRASSWRNVAMPAIHHTPALD